MKKTSIIICMVVFAVAGYSQTTEDILLEGKKLLKQGKVMFDDSYLLKARGLFERIATTDNYHKLSQYHIALCDYNLAVYYLNNKNTESFKNSITSAQEILKSLLKVNDKDVESMALLGTVYGIQVSLDPALGPTYGAQNVALVSQALGFAPGNPRVRMLNGISKFNTPDFYGGSKTEALKFFTGAVKIFEGENTNDSEIDWGHMESLAWQGRAYESLGDSENALKSFQQALVIEPDYDWVKYVLLPSLQKKMNSKN